MMKIGYEAGRGKTFTPSMNAHWTDEFNTLLNNGNMSRNALTEKLIEDGLKFNNREYILLETKGLSPEQAELLKSAAGQEILKNVLKLLLGESSNVVSNLASNLTSTSENQTKESTTIEPPKEKNEPQKTEQKSTKALDKLRSKVKSLDQVKKELE